MFHVWCINTDLKQHNKLLSKQDKTNTNYEYGIWLEWKLSLHRVTAEPPDAASVQPNTWGWVWSTTQTEKHTRESEVNPKEPPSDSPTHHTSTARAVESRRWAASPSGNPSQLHMDHQDTSCLVSPTHYSAHTLHSHYVEIGNASAPLLWEGQESGFLYYMSTVN